MDTKMSRAVLFISLCLVVNGNEDNYSTTGVTQLPDPPEVEVIGQTTTTVTINITAPRFGTITKYQVGYAYYSEFADANENSSSTIFTTPENMVPGSAYVIYVSSLNQDVKSASDTSLIAHTLPSPPTKVSVLSQQTTSLILNVTPGPGNHAYFCAEYFDVRHPVPVKRVSDSSILLSLPGLQPGTLYNTSVFTLSNNLRSPESEFDGMKLTTVPSRPQNVTISGCTSNTINLTVTPGIGGYDEFKIIYFNTQDPENVVQMIYKTPDILVGGLDPGSEYNVSVFVLSNGIQSTEGVFADSLAVTHKESTTATQDITVTRTMINTTAGDESLDDMCTISGYITGPNTAMEGSTVKFLAIFSVDINCESWSTSLGIQWYFGDVDITKKNSSRVQIQSNYSQPEIPWSYLTFNHVSILDTKPLRACYLEKCYAKSALQIQLLPEVWIYPLAVSVEVRGQTDLTCTVTEYEGVTLEFIWSFNGITQTNESALPGFPVTNNTMSVLHLRNLTKQDSGNYTCMAMLYDNNSTTIMSSTSFLYVLNKDAETCTSTTDESGLVWATTPAGIQQTQPCQNGFTGSAIRVCNTDGLWGKTNFINCVRTQIDNALKQANDIKDGLINANAIPGVLDSIAVVTSTSFSNSTQLTSGDLSKTSVVLSALVDVIDKSPDTPNVTQNFVDIIDNMLSPVNQETWTDVNIQSPTTDASDMMKTVEKLGNAVGKNISIDSPFIFQGNNIVVQIKRIRDHAIHSTLNTSTGHPNFQHKVALDLGTGNTGGITFTAALYATIGSILPSNNNFSSGYPSEVLGFSIVNGYSSHHYLPSNVSLKFDIETLRSNNNLTGDVNISCVYWNFNESVGPVGWSDVGCTWSTEKQKCLCNHLTNFAVLMSPIEITNEIDIVRLRIITLAGCSLSILSTVVTMVVYMLLWRYIKNDRSVLVMNMCVAVTAGYVLFLAGLDQTDDNVLCTVIAALLHFFFLAMFCLMLSDGIQLLRRTTVVMNVKSRLKWLLLIGWGIPAIVVGITIGIKHNGGYHSEKYCWLTLTDGVLYSFVGPVLAVIVINVVVMILVLKALLTSQFIMTKSQRQRIGSAIRSVCVLLPVLGITWFFGILSINDDLIVFQYLFAVTNSLQGFFIFLFHCILSVPVRRAMRQKYKKATSTSRSNKSQATTRSSRYSIDNVIDEPYKREKVNKLSSSQSSLHSTQSSHLHRQVKKNSPL
ncbi:adhesion G-protein coupled receptor F3-like isoform X2 [Pecten maximus]|uniref:adhesion G-protein coupled receptor F3-like isoform X2 n=1 Tax=Pecten maximus TaxID=6579 RepID=UPI0014586ABB|nr:adhesion G-protein coupled receptor F3-like isoform X2 [Pecten maximus]